MLNPIKIVVNGTIIRSFVNKSALAMAIETHFFILQRNKKKNISVQKPNNQKYSFTCEIKTRKKMSSVCVQ